MSTYFKNSAIHNFLNYLKTLYPSKTEIINKYYSLLSNIDLSEHIQLQETFRQPINLSTGETIEITWNIDDLILYLKSSQKAPNKIHPNDLFIQAGLDMQSPVFNEIYYNVKNNLHISFPHKSEFIITLSLPYFYGSRIIDGNHRFLYAVITNQPTILVHDINIFDTISFLQPNSQKFIITFYNLIDELIH